MSEKEDLAKLQADFQAYRKRMAKEVQTSSARARDEVTVKLLELVDDCDRAVRALEEVPDEHDQVVGGIEQLRDRTLRQFSNLGYHPFAEKGEIFDPRRHEAVSVESGAGPDGCILQVHRRGWQRDDGTIIRTAMVTVLKGAQDLALSKEKTSSDLPSHRRRGTSDYICPFGSPNCQGDCLGCAPPSEFAMEMRS